MRDFEFAEVVRDFFVEDDAIKEGYFGLFDVLFKWGFVQPLISDLPSAGTSPLYLKEILLFISSRTLLYGKPFEYISNTGFLHEDASRASFPLLVSPAVIKKGLADLKAAGLIISFMDVSKQIRFLGLDFATILPILIDVLKKGNPHKARKIAWSYDIIDPLLDNENFIRRLHDYKHLAGALLPRDAVAVRQELLEMCPSLFEQLALVEDLDKSRQEKVALKGEKRLISKAKVADLVGSPKPTFFDAGDFLVNWKKLIVDSGLFPTYDPSTEQPDTKLKTLAKSFLKHELDSGKSWETLKEELRVYIDGWYHIPKNKRVVTSTSREGRPYPVAFGETPDFKTFYYNQAQIKPLCREYATIQAPVSEIHALAIQEESSQEATTQKSVFNF